MRTHRTPRPAKGANRLFLALVLALLLAPAATAHLPGARPVLQRGQFDRTVGVQPADLSVIVDLILASNELRDPQRHLITHVLDLPFGRFYVEYREDASISENAFASEWRIERIIEYHDDNVNGLYEEGVDTPVKVWRLSHYGWRVSAPQNVQLEDVTGTSIVWEANLTGSPDLRIEVAAAGLDFADEGAIVYPQDVAIYMDVTNVPDRGVGSLYAIDVLALVDDETTFSLHRVDDTPTALLTDAPLRRGLFVWGGEVFIDGREERINATIADERVEDGQRTAHLYLQLPTVEDTMHLVMTSGIEYAQVNERAPWPGTLALAGALLAAALLAGRRR